MHIRRFAQQWIILDRILLTLEIAYGNVAKRKVDRNIQIWCGTRFNEDVIVRATMECVWW